MIELITGKPGAGKTYLAVQRLLSLPVGKYVIYTNIDGLRKEAFAEPDMVKEIPEDMALWMTKERQIEWAEAVREKYGRPMLVVIDEAQMWFGEKNHDRKGWLSWHRHLGQDIWLICQHYKMIHPDYYNLCEYEIRALRSSFLNLLVYQYRLGGETFKTMTKKKDPSVYAAYRSFNNEEASKASFKLVYWAAAGVIVCVGGFLLFQHMWFAQDKNPGGVSTAQAVTIPQGKQTATTNKKPPEEKPKTVWETMSYAGVLGGKVVVEHGGMICDLGDVIGEKYLVESSSRQGCVIVTAGWGKKTLRRNRNLSGGARDRRGDGDHEPARKPRGDFL